MKSIKWRFVFAEVLLLSPLFINLGLIVDYGLPPVFTSVFAFLTCCILFLVGAFNFFAREIT